MAYAYRPLDWAWICSWEDACGESSWFTHATGTLAFALQCLVAATAGFCHAFFPSLLPFVAEEIGSELSVHLQSLKEGGQVARPSCFYAFAPSRWMLLINGIEHVEFSGGSYWSHCRFACWASGQFLIGAVCAVIHALIPWALPRVAEEITLELGLLIRNRRMLRNSEGGLVNPEKLSDYLGSEYQKSFAFAREQSVCRGDIGDLDRGKAIRVKLKPGSAAQFLN